MRRETKLILSDAHTEPLPRVTDLLVLNALWIGPEPSPLHILCLLSAAARGHKVRLFSFDRYKSVPEAIEQADARDIVPDAEIVRHKKTGSPSLFSNRFRYEMIRQGLGAWTDTDMLYLRAIRTGNGNAFSLLEAGKDEVNTSFLAYDGKSAFAAELCDWAGRREMIPPWLRQRDQLWFKLRKLLGRPPHVSDLPWGVLGPHLFTWVLKKHGLHGQASPWQRFYAVPHGEKGAPFLASGNAERFITPETEAIHLWHQGLKGGMDGRNSFAGRKVEFEEGSLVWKVAREVGLDQSAAWHV